MGGCSVGDAEKPRENDPGLGGRERAAIGQENAPSGTRRKPAYRQAKTVVTARTLKAQKIARRRAESKKKDEENGK